MENYNALSDLVLRALLGSRDGVRLCFYVWITFLVSCFQSSQELCFYLWGEEATARVVRVVDHHSSKNDREGHWRVTFEFHNAETGNVQEGFNNLSENLARQYSKNQHVQVEYYSDTGIASRLKGQNNSVWVKVFVVSMALSVVSVVVLTWQGVLEQRRLDNRKWWIS